MAKNTAPDYSDPNEVIVKVVEAGGAMWYTATFSTGIGQTANSWMPPQQASTPTPLRANSWQSQGKDFIGWAIYNTATNSSNGIVVYADKAIYNFDSDVTLNAVWGAKATVKTVTFDPNDGSGSTASQSASTATALTTNAFNRSGYTFGGWNTSANGNGTAYADKASYPFTASATLYARWVAVTPVYTVTFDPNNGVGSIASQSATGSTLLTANNGAIKRTGYTFNGWNTSANGNGTAYADQASYPFTASATLYAKWGCLPLSVTASAKRVGANRTEVTFSAPQNESPWTSLAAFAAKDGGKGATMVPTSLTTGTITVTGLDKNSGYTFDVTATNAAGCVYTAQANRVAKW